MAYRSMGPSGGTGGSQVSGEIPQGATITSIEITYGDYVNAVTLNWDGGAGSTGLIGTQSGSEKETIDLAGLQVRAFVGNYGELVNQLTIVTSDGNTYGPYGNIPGPAPFRYELPAGSQLVGLIGRVGNLVDAFGIIVSDFKS